MNASGKNLSKWTIIGASVFIIAMVVVKAFWGLFSEAPFGLTVWEILAVAGCLVVLWTPIYASIYIDKISNRILGKIGGSDE